MPTRSTPSAPRLRPLRSVRLRPLLLALFVLGLLAPEAFAAVGPVGESGMAGGRARVRARLVADVDELAAGGSARLGIHYEMDPGWHMYWRNPGDTGLATEIEWKTPGVDVGPLEWPTPEVFTEGDIFTAYGYEDELLLGAPARLSLALAASDRVRVEVLTRFLVCEIQCVPGEITLRREFPVLRGGLFPRPSTDAPLFAEARANLPRRAAERGVAVSLELEDRDALTGGEEFTARLVVTACPARDASDAGGAAAGADPGGCTPSSEAGARGLFVPYEGLPFELESTVLTAQSSSGSDGYTVALTGVADDDLASGEARVHGLLAIGGARDARSADRWIEVDLPVPTRARATPTPGLAAQPPDARAAAPLAADASAGAAPRPPPLPARSAPPISWLRILGFALLGGLVLNLMPCVLPVLAIKVFALTELAHAGRSEIARHGVAYTAGVVLSMMVLAAAVAGLRSAGHAVGWGFQFQEPRFVATLAVVLVVFSLNLMGVFEVTFGGGRLADVGAHSTGVRRSFFEGLLAVVLATPCSAPFLATATGFAFAGSNAAIFGVFAAVGIGLAAPFALIAFVPGLARFLPRPGTWMVHLRAGLGFLVLASVIWLLWIAGRTLGIDGVTTLLALLLLVGAACWAFGAIQRSGNAASTRGGAIALTVASLFAVAAVPLEADPAARVRPAERSDSDLPALPFDRASVARSVADGTPTFVYFTADWCITCKVNERRVLRDERVQMALAKGGFQVFRGDWTRRDEAIREELARHGRAGVPLYLVYAGAPGGTAPGTAPELLPELLSVDDTIAAFERAAAASGS